MNACANRVGLSRKESLVPLDYRIDKRLQVRGPGFTIRIIPPAQLFSQLQQPRQP